MLPFDRPPDRATSGSARSLLPFALALLAISVGVFVCGFAFWGCARSSGRGGDGGPNPQGEVKEPPMALLQKGPLLRLEKTGGFVGYMQALDVDGDGRWRVTSLLDRRELGQGTFTTARMDSLRTAISHVPISAYGKYPAPGADLFFIRLVILAAPGAPSVEGVWPNMGLEGKQAGVPIEWNPCIELLEGALREAKAWR